MPVDSASLEAKIRECWPDATHVVRLKQVGGQRDSRTDSPALFLVPSHHSKSSTSAVRIAAFGGRDGRDGRIDSLDLSQVAAAPFVPPSLQPTDPLADLLLTSLLPCADVPPHYQSYAVIIVSPSFSGKTTLKKHREGASTDRFFSRSFLAAGRI
jgi:hypothetical protein